MSRSELITARLSPDDGLVMLREPSDDTLLQVGTVVHRYIVLRTLGQGGMGVVYLAFDSELERRVALKLVRVQDDVPEATLTLASGGSRMLREAQAMAKLSHTNVLPVYDVGSYRGAIFIATEYVDGETLHEWATGTCRRTWREVVKVFLAAGHGLAAAHAAGLVHGDFKPHNVMIGHDGQIRVTDFGLSREMGFERVDIDVGATHGKTDDGSTVDLANSQRTEISALLGTPAYMAPEQYTTLAVDASADQFSFCVALYECLYGTRPFPSQRDEMLDACRNARVAAPTVDRGVPARIRKLIMRGLSSDPKQRFPDMKTLLAALSYDRWERWPWMAAASVAVVMTASGAAVSARHLAEQGQICSGGPTRLEPVWSSTHKDVAKAAFLATGLNFAEDSWAGAENRLDSYANRWLAAYRDACEATWVHEQQSENVMDLRMRCLQRSLWQMDGLVKAFSHADATVVGKAVEAVGGLTPLERCSDVERLEAQVLPPDDPDIRARVDEQWERLAAAQALGLSGKAKEGLDKTRAIVQEASGLKYGPLEAESWLTLARFQNDAFDPAAEETAIKAILIADGNKMDEIRAQAMILLVNILANIVQRPQDAQRWGEQAQVVIDRLNGDPRLQADLFTGLSHNARISDDPERALSFALEQVEVLEPLDGVESRLAYGFGLVAAAARALGKNDDALVYLRRAIPLVEESLGVRHPTFGLALAELGRTYMGLGEYENAQTELERAEKVVEASLGADAPLYAFVLAHRGRVFVQEGRYEPAEERFARALAVYRKIFPADHLETIQLRLTIAHVHRSQAKYDEAQAEFERLVEITTKLKSPIFESNALSGLGMNLLDRGDASAAIAPLERALVVQEALGKNIDRLTVAETQYALGLALWETGRDRPRGHTLVSHAQQVFVSRGKAARGRSAAAELWLREHPAP